MRRGFCILLAVVLVLSLGGPLSAAEKYPSKPITFVIPWGAGGMTDVTGRLFAEKFKAELGQPVLVVNKPGGGGILGLKYALSQKADGYTVVVANMTDALTSPYFQGADPLPLKDLSFVAGYMPQQRVLFTTPDKPYKTFLDFIAYAKKHPGEISIGFSGSQSPMEVVKSIAVKDNLRLKYTMFKSGSEGSTAILGKHVDIVETGTGSPAFQAAREGKLILLVNLGADIVPFFPDTKNLKQLGYPFTTAVEYGMGVRAGTSEAIRKKLEDTLKKVLQNPDIKEKMSGMGLTARFLDSKAFEKICIEAEKSVPEMIKYNKALPES